MLVILKYCLDNWSSLWIFITYGSVGPFIIIIFLIPESFELRYYYFFFLALFSFQTALDLEIN